MPIYDRLVRCVVDAPRVTRFQIDWDDEDANQVAPDAIEAQRSEQQQMQKMPAPAEAKAAAAAPAPSPVLQDVSEVTEPRDTKRQSAEAPENPKGPKQPKGAPTDEGVTTLDAEDDGEAEA